MPEISKREKQLEWACRLLMIADVMVILSGYLSYFQAKRQLLSPLIPRDTIARIWYDTGDEMMKAGIIAGIIFIPGLLLYSFKKRLPALIVYATIIVYFLWLRL